MSNLTTAIALDSFPHWSGFLQRARNQAAIWLNGKRQMQRTRRVPLSLPLSWPNCLPLGGLQLGNPSCGIHLRPSWGWLFSGGFSLSPTYHSIKPRSASFMFVPLSVVSALKRNLRDAGISNRYSTSLSSSGTANQLELTSLLCTHWGQPSNWAIWAAWAKWYHVHEVYHVERR